MLQYNPIGKYNLPKMLEPQEVPLKIDSNANVILQPKFDGCQAILLPVLKDDVVIYEPVTRKGNVITRLRDEVNKVTLNSIGNPVLFSEYEPIPWSDSNKVKLSGNLYSNTPLDFNSKLVIFDSINNALFYNGEMRNSETKERLEVLDNNSEIIKSSFNNLESSIEISPWKEVTYEDALKECKDSRIETSEGTRCEILGIKCEGGIIRYQNKAQKEKPTIDKDIVIVSAIKSPKGQIGWIGLDTKDTTENGLMLVYGGVTESNHKELVGKVVEVNMLVVSGIKGAGNPTFTRSRENEKEFNDIKILNKLEPKINKLVGKNKVIQSLISNTRSI